VSVLATMLMLPSAWAGLTPGSKNIGAVWFIGDSITQSNADGDPGGSPRKSLYDLLVANGYAFTYTGHYTDNVDGLPATGGTPASNLYQYHSGISGSVIGNDYDGRTGMTQHTPTFWTSGRLAVVKPDVILIMLGANDVNTVIDLPNAPARLTNLVHTIYAQPGVGNPTIFLASITPNRTTVPTAPNNVTAFNAAIPGLVADLRTQGKDVRYVDQFTPIESAYASNMMGDNLHPNATGNRTMARQWFYAIAQVVDAITVTGTNVSAETDNSPAAGYATAAAFSADIVADDLINAGQPTLLSASWDKTPFFQTDPVNDGDGHPVSSSAGTYLPNTFGSTHLPFTYTATLNTNANTLGYEITEIRSFGGWNQNGSKLANQKYELWVRVVGGGGFTSLGTFTYAPFDDADTAEAAATQMVLRRSDGVIATGIDAVRFVVMDPGFNNGALAIDGSVYFEFDVLGSPVPTNPAPGITLTGTNVSAETDNSAAAGYATASAFSADIVADDLINVGQPTLLSASWDKPPFFETDPVNDGDGHPTGSAAGTYLPATFGSTHLPFTYTATLDTSINTLGYRITEVRSFAGWNQNGSKLANQKYELWVRVVGDAGFTSLGTFTYAPFDDADTAEAAATQMVLRRSNGVIATGIDAVRFVVMDPGFNNGVLYIDGSVYFEFDVIGRAIPVPPIPVVTITGTNVSAETDNSAAAGYATASAFTADIVADDLINAGQPTLLSASWDKPPFFETDPVNDGDGHPAGSAAGTFLPATFGGGNHLPFTYTATLDTRVNTLGYTLSEIRSFAGWNQNGASLANQKYELLVRTVGSPVFTSMGVFEYSPFDNASTQEAGATKMTVTASNSVIATGVDAVRFVVLDHGFNSSDSGTATIDGSVFFEFDVLGRVVPTTPDVAIAVNAGQVVVTFTGVLQAASTVTGTFTDVAGFPSSPLVLSTASQTNMMFFRARKP